MTEVTAFCDCGYHFYTALQAHFMKQNMGTADRILRVVAAIAIVILFYTHVLVGTVGIVLLVLAAVFLLTSLAGYCPLYSLFRISTCPVRERHA